MERMKFYWDAKRCIECNACVTACKNEHEIPVGVNRRRVVTIKDGEPGERSLSVACMHCSDAPCAAVCPVDCFYDHKKEELNKEEYEHHRDQLDFEDILMLEYSLMYEKEIKK